jgi:putative ABC transport system substrate-binding protein
VTNLNAELVVKRLQVLHDLLPDVRTMGALVNPDLPGFEANAGEMQAAARTLRLDEVHMLLARTEDEIEVAFATMSKLGIRALVIGTSAFFNNRSKQLAVLAYRHAIAAISYNREFALAGGLMSYAGSNTDAAQQVGIYAGRILKGEKPADLPVQQAVKVELVINLKTAKALGLTFPITLLGRADEVIE